MSYDRDSFLAGLAVGRTLWRPHRDYGEIRIGMFPCFPADEDYAITWDYQGITYTKFSVEVDPRQQDAHHLEPLYMMLWNQTGLASSVPWFMHFPMFLFSPSEDWDESYTQRIYERGYTQSGTLGLERSTSLSFSYHPESTIAKYTTGVPESEPVTYQNGLYFFTPDFDLPRISMFGQYPYFIGTFDEISAFMSGARMIDVQGQKYVVGELP